MTFFAPIADWTQLSSCAKSELNLSYCYCGLAHAVRCQPVADLPQSVFE
jgi:hypothetical protein